MGVISPFQPISEKKKKSPSVTLFVVVITAPKSKFELVVSVFISEEEITVASVEGL